LFMHLDDQDAMSLRDRLTGSAATVSHLKTSLSGSLVSLS